MAIDCLQEIGGRDHPAKTLVKALHVCRVFTRCSFGVLHPGIGTMFHDTRRSQFRRKAVTIHPLQQLEPRHLASARPWFINNSATLELEKRYGSAAVMWVGLARLNVSERAERAIIKKHPRDRSVVLPDPIEKFGDMLAPLVNCQRPKS